MIRPTSDPEIQCLKHHSIFERVTQLTASSDPFYETKQQSDQHACKREAKNSINYAYLRLYFCTTFHGRLSLSCIVAGVNYI